MVHSLKLKKFSISRNETKRNEMKRDETKIITRKDACEFHVYLAGLGLLICIDSNKN